MNDANDQGLTARLTISVYQGEGRAEVVAFSGPGDAKATTVDTTDPVAGLRRLLEVIAPTLADVTSGKA